MLFAPDDTKLAVQPSDHTVMSAGFAIEFSSAEARPLNVWTLPPFGSAGCVRLGKATSLGMGKLNAGVPTVHITAIVLKHGFEAWVRLNRVSRSTAGTPPLLKS